MIEYRAHPDIPGPSPTPRSLTMTSAKVLFLHKVTFISLGSRVWYPDLFWGVGFACSLGSSYWHQLRRKTLSVSEVEPWLCAGCSTHPRDTQHHPKFPSTSHISSKWICRIWTQISLTPGPFLFALSVTSQGQGVLAPDPVLLS